MLREKIFVVVFFRSQRRKIAVASFAAIDRFHIIMASVARRHLRNFARRRNFRLVDACMASNAFNFLIPDMQRVREVDFAFRILKRRVQIFVVRRVAERAFVL